MIKEKVLGIFVLILLVAVPASSLTENINDNARQTTSRISIIDSWYEQAKLTALDGAAGDWLGCSISIDGDYAIVGAYYDDSGKGSAYIFKRNGAVWVQEAKLNASDGKESDQFGCSVSIDMNHAIVGAYGKNNWAGGAYVFKRDGTTWEEKAKLTPSDGSGGDYFGYSVSIDGSRVIVGAYGDGSGSGSAYIFTRGCCGWEEAGKLEPSKGVPGDYFGYSVSIYDIRVIIGAPGDDNMGNNSGSAYIFNRTSPIWEEEQKLNASDGETGDEFGISVCINENSAIVGAYGDNDYTGSAYLFNRNDTTWIEEQKLNASDGETGDEFGVSVSMESKYIIVGTPGDDDMGSNSGSAYIFNQTETTWSQDAKLEPSEGVPGDYFGYSVSINGDYAIVGVPGDDELGTNSGSAYVFRGYNQPPNAPNIHGPTTGSAGTEYKYAFNAEDPDDDDIRYHIDWGDNNSETTAFVPSGEKVWTKYNWSEEGTYIINATAEDNCGLVSPVATLEVLMPRNKMTTNIPFLSFLQNHPNLFPIIQLLLQRLGL
jgi:hypothetical protein